MKYEDIIRVIKKCYSKNDVLTTLGYNKSSNQYKLLNKIIKENNIDISHFRNRSEEALRLYREGVLSKIKTEDLFTENSKSSRHIVKKRMINENIIEYKCSICGNTGEWLGNKISLILDHINGINNDNRIENLRFVCPNCNATLPTHCKGSKGLEPKVDKRKIYFENKKRAYLKLQSDKIEKVLNSNIDFSKLGWVEKVSKIIELPSQKTRKWLKTCLPDISKTAYIRKSK